MKIKDDENTIKLQQIKENNITHKDSNKNGMKIW